MQNSQTDVLIVGAGVIGLACAWHLLAEGRSVTVLDRIGVGAGSSHGNCGTLTPSHAPPLAAPGVVTQALLGMLRADSPLYIRPRFDPALLAWLWQFARRCNRRDWRASALARARLLDTSRHLLADLRDQHALACEYADSGLLYVCRDKATARRPGVSLESLAELDIQAERWDAERLQAEEPALKPGMAGGVFFPGDASLRPDRYVAELARLVRAAGGRIEANSEVRAVSDAGDHARLTLSDGAALRADHIVIATGAWTPQWLAPLGVRIPIQPGKGYSITYSRPALAPRRPLVLKEPSVCVTAWDSGFRLGSTMEFSGYDSRLNRTRLDALTRGARQFLHEPEGPARQEEWYGWRPMTYDDVPLIGAMPGYPRLMLACGHGMLGVSMAQATGRLVADLVCNTSPCIDPVPYSPARFAD